MTEHVADRDLPRIPVAGPWITAREVEYVTDAVTNSWYDRANEYIDRFEDEFAKYTGRRFAISLPSCTSGLHLALAALDIGPGDEVVVPDITWIASSAPIAYVGASPVFADVDRLSWCLTPETLDAVVSPRTRAVIAVDLYGNIPPMDGLTEWCADRNIALIEDAAEAVGSRYRGWPAGSFGVASAFSFHGSKTLTTGEGGMLVTDDEPLYERCMFLRDHGRLPGDRSFRNAEIAFKYKMSGLQAALGLAQLERIDELVTRKREIFAWYRDALSSEPAIELNSESDEVMNTYWMVTALMQPPLFPLKGRVIEQLADAGVDSRPMFDPLSSIPAYAGTSEALEASKRNGVAYEVSPYGVNLPSGFNITERDVERVAAVLLERIRTD